MKVYIAGPYCQGDVVVNVRNAIDAGEQIARAGFDPFIPHLFHFWHLIYPHTPSFWILEWLEVCDALIRLSGDSAGADEEVRFAQRRGIPVYFSLEEFLLTMSLRPKAI